MIDLPDAKTLNMVRNYRAARQQLTEARAEYDAVTKKATAKLHAAEGVVDGTWQDLVAHIEDES